MVSRDVYGVVQRVVDGDSFVVALSAGAVSVRVMGFDAPELGQVGGRWVAAIVRRLLLGRRVRLGKQRLDQWGRVVCDIWQEEGGRLAVALLSSGLGWHDVRFTPDRVELGAAEKSARLAKVGIWARPPVIAPWAFRRAHPARVYWRRGRNHRRKRGKC